MPPPNTQTGSQVDISVLRIRLSVAQNKRDSLTNTLSYLRTENDMKSTEASNFRDQIRQAAQEAQSAITAEERTLKEGRVVDLEWRMALASRERVEMGIRIQNVAKDIRDLNQEIVGLTSILNL